MNAKLLLDTGSAVSIITQCFFEEHFQHIAIINPTVGVTYTNDVHKIPNTCAGLSSCEYDLQF